MIRVMTVCIVFVATFIAQPALGENMELAPAGGPDPVIVVGDAATESERFAAEELAFHLREMTGRKITVVREAENTDAGHGKVIAVGVSGLTKGYDISELGVEQYIIDVTPEMIAIVGGRQEPIGDFARDRGTLYGVYEFLETLGVRWYRAEPWGWHIPKIDQIQVPVGKKISDPPAFVSRANLSGGIRRWRDDTPEEQELRTLWSSRHRLNRDTQANKYGGAVYYNFYHCHSIYVPASEYLETYPEYFALVGGQRGGGRPSQPQLCLGNPELQELFARKVIELANANPHFSSVSMEPNDGTGSYMCECELCRAMDDPASPQSVTNRLMAFGNIIARKLADAKPGVKLHALAYSAHTSPPTVVKHLEPNMIVTIAPINEWSDWSKDLLNPDSVWNARLVKAAKDWSALGTEIWMYDYWSGYAWLGPIPMEKLVAKRVRDYRDLGVRGIYNETHPSWGPQGLLMYVTAKVQWDPDIDVDEELALYYRNYYGPAAEPMRAYHEKWQEAFASSSRVVFSGGQGMHLLCTPSLMAKLAPDIKLAQDLVRGQPLYEKRLAGVVAGYELSRRISEILSVKLKDKDSVLTPQRPQGRYLQSPKAEEAWLEFEKWLADYIEGDAIFDFAFDGDKVKRAGPVRDMYEAIVQHAYWHLGNEDQILKEMGY